jgi:putative hemolysin
MLLELVIVLFLIAANGVLSGAEIAIVSVRRTRIPALLEEERTGARALAHLRGHPERFLATVQIGITVVSITAGAFGGAALAAHVEPLLRRLPVSASTAHDIALGAVIAVISYLSLVLGELVPKSLALRASERYALLIAPLLVAVSSVARPLVWLLTRSSNLVLKPFADSTNFTETVLSRDELSDLVGEAASTGTLDPKASEVASRALHLGELTAGDVMIPRTRIVALPRDAPEAVIRRCVLEERRSRIPVYQGTLDNVVGFVSAKDLAGLVWEGQLLVLDDVLRPVSRFVASTPASRLLQQMQHDRQRLAIVVDEHGAVAGLVTFEDLVEELVGEVFSENDPITDPIVHEPSGAVLAYGVVKLRDLNRALGEAATDLEQPPGITTVGGLCVHLAGGVVPQPGARLASESGALLIVVDANRRAATRVRVFPPHEPPTTTTTPH